MHNTNKGESEKGQVLLIIVMLLATVITVVTTVSFKSTTDTQLTKLEQESQKTLAAAEAGIEKAVGTGLNNNTYLYSDNSVSLNNLSGIALDKSQVTVSTQQGNEFSSPTIQNGQEYTFYLADYDTASGALSNPYNGNITLYYGSEYTSSAGCSNIALELTMVMNNAGVYTLKRYIADVSGKFGAAAQTDPNNLAQVGITTVDGVKYYCKTSQITPPANTVLLIARSLFDKTKVAMQGTVALKPQGKIITSEAQSLSGIVKKVELFQSLPQIPAEFFVTSF